MKIFEKYKMTVKMLSPVHIGTGQELLPFEYIIRDDVMYVIDLVGLLSGLALKTRSEFESVVDQNNFCFLREFIRQNADLNKHTRYKVQAADKLVSIYNKNISNPDNQLIINPFIRRMDNCKTVIPGSSLKGAIRTAVVSAATEKMYSSSKRLPDIQHRNWENEVLQCQDPKDDPFRAISIDDITLPADATIIDETKISKIKKTAGPDPGGIQQFYEVTFSQLKDKDISGSGFLTVYSGLQMKGGVSLKLSAEMLCNVCRKFYGSVMKYEYNTFYKIWKDVEKHQLALMDVKYGPMEFPLRLGRFSHCESVTVDLMLENGNSLRNPKTRLGRWGTTRTLAFDLFPMGWVKVSLQPI